MTYSVHGQLTNSRDRLMPSSNGMDQALWPRNQKFHNTVVVLVCTIRNFSTVKWYKFCLWTPLPHPRYGGGAKARRPNPQIFRPKISMLKLFNLLLISMWGWPTRTRWRTRRQCSDVVKASRVKTKSGTFQAKDLDQRPSALMFWPDRRKNMSVLK